LLKIAATRSNEVMIGVKAAKRESRASIFATHPGRQGDSVFFQMSASNPEVMQVKPTETEAMTQHQSSLERLMQNVRQF
jgi:hypothetical protein